MTPESTESLHIPQALLHEYENLQPSFGENLTAESMMLAGGKKISLECFNLTV